MKKYVLEKKIKKFVFFFEKKTENCYLKQKKFFLEKICFFAKNTFFQKKVVVLKEKFSWKKSFGKTFLPLVPKSLALKRPSLKVIDLVVLV